MARQSDGKAKRKAARSEPAAKMGPANPGPSTEIDVRATDARDRASARSTQNAIRHYEPRARAKSAAPSDTEPTPMRNRNTPAKERDASFVAPGAPVPDEVVKRFVHVGKHFYFSDGARAFTDHGKRLSTPSENTEVIRSLITIAQARGWQEIAVSGTERFRKEAWMAARLSGLHVRGYKPTEFEQERLVRNLSRHRDEPHPSTGRPTQADTKAPPAANDRRTRRDTHGQTDELVTGRLVDHGRAPYRNDTTRPMSYFVTVETARGDRTLWGVDLERAVRQSLSQPRIGDQVGLRTVRRDPVTVKTIEHDEHGKIRGNKDIAAHRNRWVVETRDFFTERKAAAKTFADPNVQPAKGARAHPELLGSYLQLRSAEELAAQRLKNPKDQEAFVARVRQALADSIAQGEPLSPVQLRQHASERPTVRPPRAPEREPAATR